MFRRDRHKTIALILSFLDSASLGNSKCYFGGGTAMAMLHGEYRTSFDLDFLVSDSESFSSLRALVRSEGLISLFDLEHRQLLSSSPARIDQYGIRSSLRFLDTEIKFEIIREGRIEFEIPLETDQILGITTLTETDLIAENSWQILIDIKTKVCSAETLLIWPLRQLGTLEITEVFQRPRVHTASPLKRTC
jgi:hypothetical protein